MSKFQSIFLAGAAALCSMASLHAASVTSAGTLADLTSPTFAGGAEISDLDSQGAGTDGFIVFNTVPEGTNLSNQAWNLNMIDNSPAYVTALDGTGGTSSGGWANYDDVTLGGNTYNTGGLVRGGVGNGVETQMFTFQLTATVPSSITIGLLVDNSDSINWDVSNLRIEGPGAITASQAVARNGGSDLVQFNINSGASGETYTVYGTAGASGALIGAVTFDSIPEPGSLSLLSASAVLLLRRRRRASPRP